MSDQKKHMSLAEELFSVRNEGTRKVICILGLKMKFRTPKLVYRELNSRLDAQEQDFNNRMNSLREEQQHALEQQRQSFANELGTRLEQQKQSFNGRISALRSKLMYKIHEYCPDEKRAIALKDWFFENTGETLNLDDPQTYNEKIQWLKLHDSTQVKVRLADKYAVRDWVKEKIGEQYLIPLLGVWDKFEDIDFDSLPQKFVLKCNHGSGYNIVVTDKAKLDLGGGKTTYNIMDE